MECPHIKGKQVGSWFCRCKCRAFAGGTLNKIECSARLEPDRPARFHIGEIVHFGDADRIIKDIRWDGLCDWEYLLVDGRAYWREDLIKKINNNEQEGTCENPQTE